MKKMSSKWVQVKDTVHDMDEIPKSLLLCEMKENGDIEVMTFDRSLFSWQRYNRPRKTFCYDEVRCYMEIDMPPVTFDK